MRELPIRSLSRSQQRRVQDRDQHRFARAFNNVAEEIVAEEFGLSTFNDAGWYDLEVPETGTKYEVKSTSSEVGDKYPGTGRFRLWRSQHRSLTASEGAGMAWYAFVVLDEDAGSIKIQRRRPTTVTRLVNERGGWNDAGHERYSEQHKLPWPVAVR